MMREVRGVVCFLERVLVNMSSWGGMFMYGVFQVYSVWDRYWRESG